MEASHKDYLGDSIYIEIEDGMLKLYLDNGHGPSDTIYLQTDVYEALTRYVARIESIYADKPEKTA
jgi:hypothetical protein